MSLVSMCPQYLYLKPVSAVNDTKPQVILTVNDRSSSYRDSFVNQFSVLLVIFSSLHCVVIIYI